MGINRGELFGQMHQGDAQNGSIFRISSGTSVKTRGTKNNEDLDWTWPGC